MKTRTGMIGIAAILTAAALSGGIAQARTGQPATSRPAAETVQTTDTDSLQQGDQTSPDAADRAAAKPAHAKSGQGASEQVKENQGENANEGAGENQGERESEHGNDGPGGHQDPPGDVQHEGGNNEK